MLGCGVEAASAGLADEIGLDYRDGAAVPCCRIDKPRIDIGADALVEPVVSKGGFEGVARVAMSAAAIRSLSFR